jgi:hypothetical protein
MPLVRMGAMGALWQGRRERSYPVGMDATEDAATAPSVPSRAQPYFAEPS